MVKDYNYLIIGGTTKAGTTSLFNYLKDHPEVCASNIKETRFFLNKKYPLELITDFHITKGIEEYNNFFNHCKKGKIRVESTPDYLYSEGTAELIYKNLPNSKMIFILRDPIDRLISWYRFAKQNNFLEENISFEDYIEMQIKSNNKNKQYLLALEQGNYSKYLEPYFDLFGKERILLVKFEELSKTPKKIMKQISNFAEINSDFYENYDFKIYNKTMDLKYPKLHGRYISLRKKVRKYSHNKPYLQKSLRILREAFENLYFKINKNQKEFLVINDNIKNFLKDYYRDEINSQDKIK